MKKAVIYIIILSFVAIVSVGGTYALFRATVTKNNTIGTQADTLEIEYTGDIAINGALHLAKIKEGGHRRVIKLGLSEQSVGIAAHLYIQIQKISPALAVNGLKWEVYTLEDGTEKYYNSGTFMQCGGIEEIKSKCVSGDRLYMVTDYDLSTIETEFVVYIWLNGSEVGNEVLGESLIGEISVETEHLTAELS